MVLAKRKRTTWVSHLIQHHFLMKPSDEWLQNYENSVIARWIWQKFWDNLAKKKHCFDLLYCLRPYHYNSHDHQDKAKYLYRADGLPGGSKPAVVLHSEAKRQLA